MNFGNDPILRDPMPRSSLIRDGDLAIALSGIETLLDSTPATHVRYPEIRDFAGLLRALVHECHAARYVLKTAEITPNLEDKSSVLAMYEWADRVKCRHYRDTKGTVTAP